MFRQRNSMLCGPRLSGSSESESGPFDGGEAANRNSVVPHQRQNEKERLSHAELLEPVEKESYYPSGELCARSAPHAPPTPGASRLTPPCSSPSQGRGSVAGQLAWRA